MRRILRFIRKRGFVTTLAPALGFFVLKLLRLTLRIAHRNRHHLEACVDRGGPVIYAFWHGRMLMMPFARPFAFAQDKPHLEGAVLISHHRDGESIGRIAKRFGFFPIRGSATRGGAEALRKMVTVLQQGFHVVITPDGPRGPREKAKIGVIEVARLSGCPILPVAFSASSRLFLKSWDAFLIPLPFSRGVYIWGEPLSVRSDADRGEMAKKRQILEERLNALTMEADAFFG